MKLTAPRMVPQPGQRQPHYPQVGPDARGVGRAGQRRVRVPAERRRPARREEAGEQDQSAEREEVVAEQVQPRERHVGGPDLQRQQLVGEADEQRGGEQQQHDRAVHREQLVVLLVGQDVLVRAHELDPDQQRHDPRAAEEEERGNQVHVADHLVVGRRQPARQDRPFAPRARRGARSRCLPHRCHRTSSSAPRVTPGRLQVPCRGCWSRRMAITARGKVSSRFPNSIAVFPRTESRVGRSTRARAVTVRAPAFRFAMAPGRSTRCWRTSPGRGRGRRAVRRR